MPEERFVRVAGPQVRWLRVDSVDALAQRLARFRPGGARAYAIVLEGAVYALGAKRFQALVRAVRRRELDAEAIHEAFLDAARAVPAGEQREPTGRTFVRDDAVWVPEAEVGPEGPRRAGPPRSLPGHSARELELQLEITGGTGGHDLLERLEEVMWDDDLARSTRVESVEELEPEVDLDAGPPLASIRPHAEPETTITRTPHLAVDPPAPLAPGQGFTVSVFCDDRPPDPEETSLAIVVQPPPGTDRVVLSVWLSASDHFDVGEGRGELTLHRGEPRSAPLSFPARVVDDPPPGPGRLGAVFSYGGLPSGHVTRTLAIAGGEAEPEAAADAGAPPRIVVREGQRRPDLVVEVKAVEDGDRLYDVRVLTADRPDPARRRWYVKETTPALVASFMEEFTAEGLDDDERASQLRGAGMALWSAAPEEFREVFWSLVDDPQVTLESILVVSDDWAFPWELMVPHRGTGTALKVREPLGVEFRIGRWVDGAFVTPRDRVPLNDSYTLAPWYPKPNTLVWAPTEAKFVCEHFDGEPIDPATVGGIERWFGLSGVSLLHVICHGEVSTGSSQVIRLAKQRRLLSHQVLGMTALRTAMAATEPMVFLNACQVGRPQPALIGVGGFATAFIAAGARCVIAPLWSVSDKVAHQFATAFYTRLLERPDLPLADAVRELRGRAYGQDGADTWAAYCFYGNPLAIPEIAK